jgi:hypothetical protein
MSGGRPVEMRIGLWRAVSGYEPKIVLLAKGVRYFTATGLYKT